MNFSERAEEAELDQMEVDKRVSEKAGALLDRINVLSEALLAAEAECQHWRQLVGEHDQHNEKKWWHHDGKGWFHIDSADANDATRARLGLGKIGEE